MYWPCRNLATKPTDQFEMDPADFAKAEETGSVVAVVHSHPDATPEPSPADRVGCERSNLPWHILAWPRGDWSSLEPVGFTLPLEGREFVHGLTDCYALIRDWYWDIKGLALPDFDRQDGWWDRGQNLYLDHYEECGFARVPDWESAQLLRGDILLMQVRSTVPNHAAVYTGDNLIMHHLPKRLSCVEPFLASYRKMTTHALRRSAC
jgi:proteasome lid subunit RPN8/RPN11